ncbi:TonB-dependent receptor [Novosphingobium album (ex Liu et al. 2023)]|uniref:TonB-dependent receptor n=1 Tax=Novosphingobium album (ex Liu et al. 2023) TaxID=3031130 RepID=A0ABT5WQP7_9SPHN|nr:TonB-dependent receptor [Novosphingobium album (ex Liu et al. 2023)]MDE8652336.1 TonB-dependent receptor [Novosphingobium album (ex Liu et al. 2023)]
MLRLVSLAPIAAVLLASPALAREERIDIAVPASRLDQAVRVLGRQSGASIGFRDRDVARLKVRAVRGRLTTGEALVLMLRQSGARARRVAADTFLIEIDPEARREAAPVPVALSVREEPRPLESPPPIEIVVTGTKREIPIGAYPGMVHIVEGDRVSVAAGKTGTDAIEATTASVISTHLGPGRNKLFIRGIADSSFVGPTQATVGQYWGNSRITYSAPDPSLKLYDVRRIEVLEGPQGTLYGAGSLGGIVRVVPREPQLDEVGGTIWSGIEGVEHGRPGIDGGAVINLPLVAGKLGLRAVGFGSVENGYIDDVGRGLKDINDVDSAGGRVSLRYEGEAGWTVDASVVGQRIDGKDSQYTERDLGGLKRSSAMAQPYRNDFLLADVVLRKTWDDIEFTSSFGFAYQKVFELFEGPALANPADAAQSPVDSAVTASYSQSNRIHMFTGEARLARSAPDGTGWLIAASLLRNEARVNRGMNVMTLRSPLTGVNNRVEEATVYGEATLAPAARLNLTVGGRLTYSRLSGDVEDALQPLSLVYKLDPGARASRSETRFLPSVALAYQSSDKATFFARYQEGFRPGGVAARREYVQRYQGDRVRSLEAGVRYRGDGLELETSTSWTDWRDIQADLIDGYGFPTTTNVGNGRVLSFGASGRWRPAPALELDAAVYLNRSKVTERKTILNTLQPSAGPASFTRLPNIADVTARVGFTWSAPLDAGHDLEVSGFGRYVGDSTLGIGPVLGQPQGDYVDTGLEATLHAGDVRYSLSLTNLLDAKGNRFALGSPFQVRDRNQITPLQPRSIRLGVQFDF